MKKFKIVNKKVFVSFMVITTTLVGTIFFSIFKIINSQYYTHKNNVQITQEKTIEDNHDKVLYKPEVENLKIEQTSTESSPTYNKYDNQNYSYSMTYPSDWYLFSDSSEEKLEDVFVQEKNVATGGQTFLSNYKNISDYSPEQKPDDFHLLALTIYEPVDMGMNELVHALGFSDESILKKNTFEGNSMIGAEFIALGTDERNPRAIIVFQNGKRFFVFNLGFINGDTKTAEIMENIAKTFTLK